MRNGNSLLILCQSVVTTELINISLIITYLIYFIILVHKKQYPCTYSFCCDPDDGR